ncbi:MAG: hypothetical protein IIC67_01635 [Thaumarchaeota archaeon]|nr:hypothetical protein [Nitrososphaerota archaeon]
MNAKTTRRKVKKEPFSPLGQKSLVIPICMDVKEMMYNLGDLHPTNYGVSKGGNITVSIQGKIKFDFEKNELLIYVWEEE